MQCYMTANKMLVSCKYSIIVTIFVLYVIGNVAADCHIEIDDSRYGRLDGYYYIIAGVKCDGRNVYEHRYNPYFLYHKDRHWVIREGSYCAHNDDDFVKAKVQDQAYSPNAILSIWYERIRGSLMLWGPNYEMEAECIGHSVSRSGLPVGTIVGITIGVLVGLVLLSSIFVGCIKAAQNRKRRNNALSAAAAEAQSPGITAPPGLALQAELDHHSQYLPPAYTNNGYDYSSGVIPVPSYAEANTGYLSPPSYMEAVAKMKSSDFPGELVLPPYPGHCPDGAAIMTGSQTNPDFATCSESAPPQEGATAPESTIYETITTNDDTEQAQETTIYETITTNDDTEQGANSQRAA